MATALEVETSTPAAHPDEQTFARGFQVDRRIDGAHPKHVDYPLLPGDVLVPAAGGSWTKVAPGLAVCGFILDDAQREGLREVGFATYGLTYRVRPA